MRHDHPTQIGKEIASGYQFETTYSRLLAAVRPLAYHISLVPNIQKLQSVQEAVDVDFAGHVKICFDILRPTNAIVLNADGLAFVDKGVLLDGVAVKKVTKGDRVVTLAFPQTFGIGPHVLEIDYTGTFSSKPQGIYYSDYRVDIGEGARPHRIVVTQFEATDARRMLPCWDEPMFKAEFTLSVELPAGHLAISNTPGTVEPAPSGSSRWTFETTPRMSSYLLVLVGGELARLTDQGISKGVGVDVGVVAPVGRQRQGRYALEALKQLIPYYNDYFGIGYPLPKLDLIAIPDFVYMAMENWGGITYIDNVVLIDEDNSPHKTKESVFETIAHELAHQWSGNLVTMAWWDDLWLNEGFATWMHKKATDRFNPSWEFRIRAHEDKQSAMALDALNSSKEIHHDIVDDSEADSAFDHITYRKGAALIRMIEDYLGEDVFRDGMRLYMDRHKYSNATTADLWDALRRASGKDVSSIAAGFVSQPGIPLIDVEQVTVDGRLFVKLKQGTFSIHGAASDGRRWSIPVRAGRSGDQASQMRVVGEAPETMEFEGDGRPVKVNLGEVGYYRTRYDAATLGQIGARFNHLSAADQVGLLADSWAMVQAGYYEPASYFDLLTQAAGSRSLALWTDVVATLREVDALERGTSGRNAFRTYARVLLQPILAELTWDPRPGEADRAPLDSMLRALVIMALGRFGDADVVAEARKRFAEGADRLDNELREAVAVVVGYVADGAVFAKLRKLGMEAASTEIRLMYYFALAGAGNPTLTAQMIEIALSNELPTGRVDRFLVAAASTGDDPDRVWDAVLAQRDALFNKLSDLQNQRLLALVAASSSSPRVADELLAQPVRSPGASYEARRAAEQIRLKADLRNRLVPKIDAWIEQHPNQHSSQGASE